LSYLSDPKSYAGGSIGAGRASLTRLVEGGDVRLRQVPWSSRLEVGRKANNLAP
jgi:hypothetical protein